MPDKYQSHIQYWSNDSPSYGLINQNFIIALKKFRLSLMSFGWLSHLYTITGETESTFLHKFEHIFSVCSHPIRRSSNIINFQDHFSKLNS